jgi:hypothetical protein
MLRRTAILALTALLSAPLALAQQPKAAGVVLDAFKTAPAAVDAMTPEARGAFGQKLANELYAILSRVGSPTGQVGGAPNATFADAVPKVKNLIDAHALLQRATEGYAFTKTSFPPSDIDNFEISGMHVTHPRSDLLVLRYKVKAPQSSQIDQKTIMSGDARPEMIVLLWNKTARQWRIVSSANFNTPIAQICGQAAPDAAKKPHGDGAGNQADLAIAKQQIQRLHGLIERDALREIVHDEIQVQYAGGAGFTTSKEVVTRRAPSSSKAVNSDFQVRRAGDVLVVRYNNTVKDHVVDQVAYSEAKLPRLVTLLRGPDAQWKVIAFAALTFPKAIPAGTACVKPTVR